MSGFTEGRGALRRIALFIIAAAAPHAATADVRISLTPRETVAARIRAVASDNKERGDELRELFSEAGCAPSQLELQPVRHSREPNVICTVPGESAARIVVGAHFDKVKAGLGVIDDWSGAALLPCLVESVRSTPRRHTFVFVGFTDEEKGLVGSAGYVRQLGKEVLASIRAMIDFDSLGTGPTAVDAARANRQLLTLLLQSAASVKLPLQLINVGRVGTSDFAEFAEKHVPVLMMHSITQEQLGILHTNNDNMAAFRMDDYYQTYRLAAVYLSYLDATLDAATAQNPRLPAPGVSL